MENEQPKQEYESSNEMEEEIENEKYRIARSEEKYNSQEESSRQVIEENKNLIFGKEEEDDPSVQPLAQPPLYLGDYLNDLEVHYMTQNDIFKQQIGLEDFYPFEYCKEENNNSESFFDSQNDPRYSFGQLKHNQEKEEDNQCEENRQILEIDSKQQKFMEIEETLSFDNDKQNNNQSSQFLKQIVSENSTTDYLLPFDIHSTYNSSEKIINQQKLEDVSSHSENFHKVSFGQKYLVKQNNQQIARLSNPDSPIGYLPMRMYVYLDIVLDLGFLKETIDQGSYLRSNANDQLYSGLRSIIKTVHRVDTKSIEIHTEFCQNHLHYLKYIVDYLMSLQDQKIQQQAQKIDLFRRNIEKCKAAIKAQNKQVEFKIHQKQRQKSCNSELNRITSEIKSDQLVFYVRYSVNFLKGNIETNLSGYSPALQELLFGSSYAFQQFISEKGYFDPMGKMFKLRDCFEMSLAFTGSEYTQSKMDEGYSVLIDLVTIEGFCFPTMNVQKYYALSGKYDEENNLNFQFGDLLTVNTFTLLDPTALQFLKEERIEQSLQLNVKNLPANEDNEIAVNLSEKDYAKTLFFRKYYCDQIPNLVRVGNKWNKRCGFVDINIQKE